MNLKNAIMAAAITFGLAAPAAAAEKYKIGYDIYFGGNSWSVQLYKEFQAEAEKHKDTVDVAYTESELKADKQVANIEDLITKGMNAIIITPISGQSRFGFLPLARERGFGEEARRRFSIRSTDLEQPAGQLSGGNQQKVVFARWLANKPKLLVLHEPTKGVDIQSKTEIYHLVDELTRSGVSVILISSDLIELIGLSDRILTMFEGRITGEIGRADFSEERIMRLAAGVEAVKTVEKVAEHV